MSYLKNADVVTPGIGLPSQKQDFSSTGEVTFHVSRNGYIILTTSGPVRAIHFKYKFNAEFSNLLGAGVLLAAANKNLIMLSLGNKSLEGKIISYNGQLNMHSIKVVGFDSKYVQNVYIERDIDTWTALSSEWDSAEVNYNQLNFKGKSGVPSKSKKHKSSMFEDVKIKYSSYKGGNVEIYLKNKLYDGPYHIYHDTAAPFTGAKPSPGMKPLSYNKTIKRNNAISEPITHSLSKSIKSLKGKGFKFDSVSLGKSTGSSARDKTSESGGATGAGGGGGATGYGG